MSYLYAMERCELRAMETMYQIPKEVSRTNLSKRGLWHARNNEGIGNLDVLPLEDETSVIQVNSVTRPNNSP